MRISVIGLGYVGTVSAACLAQDGHHVMGVDLSQTKVDLINKGQSPIIEPEIGDIIPKLVQQGQLTATTDVTDAILRTDISLICVGTPSRANGSLDLTYVERVCKQIGTALRKSSSFQVVVARSTMLPGTMRNMVIPTLEKHSGKKAGKEFGVCNNPEFLREGTAVYDFYHPPKTVIGEVGSRSGEILASLYKGLDAPEILVDIETAEMVKYTDNVWHALKIGFANEIGNLCKAFGVDSHKVMDIFCHDTKLNLSPYYLKPGFAFGGSCLPKDVRALIYKGRCLDLELPILNAILPSNELQVERGLNMIMNKGNKKVGLFGLSFKAGTDDMRESPLISIVERLLGKGFDIRIFDENVNIASLVGANRDYILNHIPHIYDLMDESMDAVLEHAETVVIGNNAKEFRDIHERRRDDQVLVDFVRIFDHKSEEGKYDGICW
ncbi:UDP-glucose 6-dehydrogenase [Candidatus Thiomargarita nelsonii]|uniref:UDP-glucose 6-dehydrogenase n=1 Tax=Candidatus Thiomargarita nelsonii TaxID=1003181 RepID=A0A0A6NZX3_9GAMM|nr:UDP-glucose 6-dehydrogenase [Candidatus Thiomargarita nelsonii]